MSDTYIPAAMRRLVHERAGGQCEYCLTPDVFALAAHEIDHIIAEKHGGLTTPDNLALSCALCNKRKGTDLTSLDPQTNTVVLLYHPRRDHWRDHFRLEGTRIAPLTPTARATVRMMQLNNLQRLAERELLIAAGLLKIPD